MPRLSKAHKIQCRDFSKASEPSGETPHATSARDDGGMHCAQLAAALDPQAKLTRTDLSLLWYFLKHPHAPHSRAEIAAICGCAPNSVPRSARKLERDGWIERVIKAGERTTYKLGRNLTDTTGNDDVTGNEEVTTRNADVASVETLALRTSDGVVTKSPATESGGPSRNTPVTRVVTAPPIDNNHTPPEPNPEKPEIGGEGVPGGDGFALNAEPPKRKRQAKRRAFVATEDTLPETCPPELAAYALTRGLRNGTLEIEWTKFRRWHIRAATTIKSLEQRWDTWVDNWANRTLPKQTNGEAPQGYVFAGVGEDGRARYVKDQSKNVYR